MAKMPTPRASPDKPAHRSPAAGAMTSRVIVAAIALCGPTAVAWAPVTGSSAKVASRHPWHAPSRASSRPMTAALDSEYALGAGARKHRIQRRGRASVSTQHFSRDVQRRAAPARRRPRPSPKNVRGAGPVRSLRSPTTTTTHHHHHRYPASRFGVRVQLRLRRHVRRGEQRPQRRGGGRGRQDIEAARFGLGHEEGGGRLGWRARARALGRGGDRGDPGGAARAGREGEVQRGDAAVQEADESGRSGGRAGVHGHPDGLRQGEDPAGEGCGGMVVGPACKTGQAGAASSSRPSMLSPQLRPKTPPHPPNPPPTLRSRRWW